MLKYRAIKKKEIPEDLSEKHLDFEAVLKRFEQNNLKEKQLSKLNNYRWVAAASFAILISVISYALLTEKKTKPKKSAPLQKMRELKKELLIHTYRVPANERTKITTDDSLSFVIGENILLAENSTDTAIVNISAKEPLNESDGFLFYIGFKNTNTTTNENIQFELPYDSLQLFYGGNDPKSKLWRKVEQVKNEVKFIKAPTQLMKNYQHYLSTKLFIDSITKHYQLENGYYMLKNKKGFKFSKKFVLQQKELKSAYEQKGDFDSTSRIAARDWKLFKDQHTMKVSRNKKSGASQLSNIQMPIQQVGWYKVTQRKREN